MAEADTSPAKVDTGLAIGSVQIIEPQREAIKEHRIVGFDSRDVRARPFSILRTRLARKLKDANYRLVGMTSATPAAGKSFLSMNLAGSLARVSERPVYLVDLDFRRASLAEELGYEPEYGVESYLEGTVDNLADIACNIEGTNLVVLPAVRRDKNTAELLAGERFAQMVKTLRDASDASIILFDLPPAFANDDAMIALEHLDTYLMVVDSGKTSRKQVQEVTEMMYPIPCIGSILNRYSGGIGDSYGYGYGGPDYRRYYD